MSRIEDVALAAGVSTATVSRALRGLDKVSDATRARVQAAAEQLHYVASPTASSLASGKTMVVGVVVPYVTRWYFAHLISGASEVLRERGYHVLLFDVGDEGEERTLLLDSRMLVKRVDAVLILSLRLQVGERALLHRLGVPVVTVGVPYEAWPCVRIDDVASSTISTEHLIGLGHRRIGYIGGDSVPAMDFPTPVDRRRGFVETMARAGLPVADGWVQGSDWMPEGGRRAARAMLEMANRPTAIVAASDEIAFGVTAAARELGLAVPREVSVIGIDDHSLAAVAGLTTVSQDVVEQGRIATRLLLEALAGQPLGHGVVQAPIRLMVRSTTAPPSPTT